MPSPTSKGRVDWKIFIPELIFYAALVLIYFAFVLHYWGGWLKDVYEHDRWSYASIALLLMIGQSVGLEAISAILFRVVWRREK